MMNKLKEIRQGRKITQMSLAIISRISLANIKHLEMDSFDFRKCRYETLEKLSNALKVPVDYFLK